MKTLDATEAARGFKSALNTAEGGEAVLIVRHGRPAALLTGYCEPMSGRNAAKLFEGWNPGPDANRVAGEMHATIRDMDERDSRELAH